MTSDDLDPLLDILERVPHNYGQQHQWSVSGNKQKLVNRHDVSVVELDSGLVYNFCGRPNDLSN